MIERGLSDETVSRLRYYRASGILDDGMYGHVVSQHLDYLDEMEKSDEVVLVVKALQAFINPSMYNDKYGNETDEGPANIDTTKQIKPTPEMKMKAMKLLEGMDNAMVAMGGGNA